METGYRAEEILGPASMARACGARVAEVVRLESVAEEVAGAAPGAAVFAEAFATALDGRARDAAGLKSVIAYRHGLDFDPEPPDAAEVRRAAGRWLRRWEGGEKRLIDPVLLRHLLWVGVECRLPLQFHVGYGDPDLTLHRCDPSLMTGFLRRVQDRGVAVMLLHCYPYHRTAGYLAAVFPHVYLDVGLAVNPHRCPQPGARGGVAGGGPVRQGALLVRCVGAARAALSRAVLWRRAMTEVLGEWVASGDWSQAMRCASPSWWALAMPDGCTGWRSRERPGAA